MKTKSITSKGRAQRVITTDCSPLSGLSEAGRVYLALDVHAAHCVLGAMREDGTWLGELRLPTSAEALRKALTGIQCPEKWLTFEEGGMSLWLCDLLRPLRAAAFGVRSAGKRVDRQECEEAR